MKRIAVVLAVVLVTAAVPVGSVAAQQSSTDSSTYAGTHVSFETNENAVTNYSVGGETVLQSVSTSSRAEAGIGLDVGLSAVTDIDASALSLETTTETSATVRADSGATVSAHDNPKGTLVVAAGDESQYVTANLSGASNAEQVDDSRVVVENDGRTGTFIVVGDGDVTVNEDGNVSANLAEDSRLVFRSYDGERTAEDERAEELIANGSAAAEVYVMEANGSTVTDTVTYDEHTTVETAKDANDTVTMTVNRSVHEGAIVMTTVSEEALAATDDLSVTVDGEAAVEAESYSELQSAANGGDNSAYLVQETSADAESNVYVAVNHFSERQVTMTNGDAGSEQTTDETSSSSSSAPGFGVGVSVVALAGAALLARRQA
ncbi:PGF-CTERM sorting domain-containing protein [Haloferax namakaokahaiae]|uniref:PGF-CTERM sorting domain-containing protein n=1 Tax=Haloferax namakaokahaiae TaxID=1748331 RepID=A0ABD5ZH74_9EURY